MMTGNTEYAQFSNIAFGGGPFDRTVLLEKPSKVSLDGYLAFASALYLYMTPFEPAPSLHEIMTEYWEPNAYDTARGIKAGFGATINVLSEMGDNECGGSQETSEA